MFSEGAVYKAQRNFSKIFLDDCYLIFVFIKVVWVDRDVMEVDFKMNLGEVS